MIDVAVTHTLAPTVARLQSPDKRPLAAANATAKLKHNKYDNLAASLGHNINTKTYKHKNK